MTKLSYIKTFDNHYLKSIVKHYYFNNRTFKRFIFSPRKLSCSFGYTLPVSEMLKDFIFKSFNEPYPPIVNYKIATFNDMPALYD